MIRPVCKEDFCEVCGRCLYCHGGDECSEDREHVWPEHLSDPLTKTGLPRCGHPKRGGGTCSIAAVAGFEKCWRHRHLEPLPVSDIFLEDPVCRECRSRTADPSLMKGLCWHCANDLVENGVRQ